MSRYHDTKSVGIPQEPWTEITDGLYVGGSERGYPREQFAGVVSVYDWHWERSEWLPNAGTPHAILPMYDSAEIKVPYLRLAGEFIDHHLGEGDVLVRCQAGLNRSSLVAAYYMCEYLDYTGPKAIAEIRQKRSEHCLFNKSFVYWLTEQYPGKPN